MVLRMLSNEWRAFRRSKAFGTNIWLKILMGIGALYFAAVFAGIGVGTFFILKEMGYEDPFVAVNQFMIYVITFDLVMRFLLQKMPTDNIRPLIIQPMSRRFIVNYALGKTVFSFFNIIYLFFFIPFSAVMFTKGYDPSGIIAWNLGMFLLILFDNFVNVFANTRNDVFYPLAVIIFVLGFLQYQELFDITEYTGPLFYAMYEQPLWCIVPIGLLGISYFTAVSYFKTQLYLDAGLATKTEKFREGDLAIIDRFGDLAPFIRNDIRMIIRNKRARMTVIMAVIFVFYGLLYLLPGYDQLWFKVFAGLFVTGGFLFSYGGFVPSWDSSYYKLMMSQNIPYRKYLLSKWYLMVVATIFSTILSSFYAFVDFDLWLAMLAGAVYNIGFNSSVVLWSGAYVKTPIDLTSAKAAFGGSKAFNVKTILISLPKILLPIAVFYAGYLIQGTGLGFILVAVTGLLGLLFRNKLFDMIEKIYKKEKYDTISAYAE